MDFADGLSICENKFPRNKKKSLIRENKFPRKKFFFPLIREKFKIFSLNHKSCEEFHMGININETDNFITRILHLFCKIRKVINKI